MAGLLAKKQWSSSSDLKLQTKEKGLRILHGTTDPPKDSLREACVGIDWIVMVTARISKAVERLGTPQDTDESRALLEADSKQLVHHRALRVVDVLKLWTEGGGVPEESSTSSPTDLFDTLCDFYGALESFHAMQDAYIRKEDVFLEQAHSLLELAKMDTAFEPTTLSGAPMTKEWLDQRAAAVTAARDLLRDVDTIMSETKELRSRAKWRLSTASQNSASQLASKDGVRTLYVLHDFCAEGPNEMTCRSGSIVEVCAGQTPCYEGWTWCRDRSAEQSARGLVPTAYLGESSLTLPASPSNMSHSNPPSPTGGESSPSMSGTGMGGTISDSEAGTATRRRARSGGSRDDVESPSARSRWLMAFERSKKSIASPKRFPMFDSKRNRSSSEEWESKPKVRKMFGSHDSRAMKMALEEESEASLDGTQLDVTELRSGVVVCTLPNGSVYEGEWKDRQRSGFGKYTMTDKKKVFQGMFKNDEPCSAGILMLEGEGRYAGPVAVAGQGVIAAAAAAAAATASSSRRPPSMKAYDLVREGWGTMTYNNGSVYSGYWQADKPHGLGILTNADGETYYGLWSKGKMHGVGLLLFTDGSYYLGGWASDRRDGKGTLFTSTGHVIDGTWKDGAISKASHSVISIKKCPSVSRAWAKAALSTCSYKAGDSQRFIGGNDMTSLWLRLLESAGATCFAPPTLAGVAVLLSDDTKPFATALAAFSAYIQATYSQEPASNPRTKKRIQTSRPPRLARCIDDVRAFMVAVCTSLKSLADPPDGSALVDSVIDESEATLEGVVAEALFPKVYDTVFALIKHEEIGEDALLSDKMAAFSSASCADLGVPAKLIPDVTPAGNADTPLSTCSGSSRPRLCEYDETDAATMSCTVCDKVYCALCDDVLHRAPAMRAHTRTPLLPQAPSSMSRRIRTPTLMPAFIEAEEGGSSPVVESVHKAEQDTLNGTLNKENEMTEAGGEERSRNALAHGAAGEAPKEKDSRSEEGYHRRPFSEAIKVVGGLQTARSPLAKAKVLLDVSAALVTSVQEACPGRAVVLGAEDKFPILLYVLLAAGPAYLASEARFLATFCGEEVVGLEAAFRLTEFEAAIKYIRTLDWNVRDSRGVLVPHSSIHEKLRATVRQITESRHVPGSGNLDILWFVGVLRQLGSRRLGDYSPLLIKAADVKRTLIKSPAAARLLVRAAGLCLTVTKDAVAAPVGMASRTVASVQRSTVGCTGVPKRSRAQSMSRSSLEQRNTDPETVTAKITFDVCYPLYVYGDLAMTLKQSVHD